MTAAVAAGIVPLLLGCDCMPRSFWMKLSAPRRQGAAAERRQLRAGGDAVEDLPDRPVQRVEGNLQQER
jgi:hypothetical protein